MRYAIEIIKRYSLREVALLVVFAFGLLIAGLIVLHRSGIEMSEGVSLLHSGVSVSIPTGRGWDGSESWVYEGVNEFRLNSALRVGLDSIATVQCRYMIASERVDGRELLEKDIAAAGLSVGRSGQISNDVMLEWAELYKEGKYGRFYLGIADLGSGRILVLNVHAPGDSRFANKLFRLVAKSIRFEPNEMISRGEVFVGQMKNEGVIGLARKYGDFASEGVWLIEDEVGKARGFQIESFAEYSDGLDWAKVKAQRTHYVAGTKGDFTQGILDSSDGVDRFIWRRGKRSLRRPGSGVVELELNPDGSMRVSGVGPVDLTSWPGAGAVPEILLDLVAGSFLGSYSQDLLVDVIFDDGRVVPTVISSLDVSMDTNNSWGASYGVKFEFFGRKKSALLMYFDYNKRLVGKVEEKRDVLIWHRSDRETVTEKFGSLERYSGRRSMIRQNEGAIDE